MTCGIYERRPMACRIYPAEVNPFLAVDPGQKLCPPEAWESDALLQTDTGAWADTTVAEAVDRRRGSDYREASAKGRLCELLGIDAAGLTNEGVVTYSPERSYFLAALDSVSAESRPESDRSPWIMVSHRDRTLDLLASAGAESLHAGEVADGSRGFIAFVEPGAYS
jgi:hypothetical protein